MIRGHPSSTPLPTPTLFGSGGRWIGPLGGFPGRPPLKPRVAGRVEEARYWGEKVCFGSDPHEPVVAYVLVPKDAAFPAPAVLALHQHAGEYHLGKSEPAGLAEIGRAHV